MNFKKAVIFLGCAASVCALLNCLIMFFTVENSSGFFKTGYSSVAALMVFLVAVLIVLSAMAFSRVKRPQPPAFWPYVCAVLSVALGICFLLEAFKFSPLSGTTNSLAAFVRIFAVLSGIIFLWRGANELSFVPILKEIYVIPVIYLILKVISTFVAYVGVAAITETVFELFAICAMLIFTLNFAKAQNGIKNKKGDALSAPLCVACALVVFTQIAPYAINYFAKEEALLHANSLFAPTSIVISLFIISVSIFKEQPELD